MKIVINACYGGFDLSIKCVKRYAEIKGIELYPYYHDVRTGEIWKAEEIADNTESFIDWTTKELDSVTMEELDKYFFSPYEIKRDDPALVQAVEELGEEANTFVSILKVIEIPDNVRWELKDSYGFEKIEEKHREWN